jgi:lipopolysaccharide biosynthesis glycosyltransferase
MSKVPALDVALAFDAGYAPYARVALESLFDAESKQVEPARIRLWLVVADDVTQQARDGIVRQVGARATIRFLTAGERLAGIPGSRYRHLAHLSNAMYLRLVLPELVPDDVRRVVYLDSDVLCVGSIAPLFGWDLRGKPLGAVRDAFTRRIADSGGMPGIQAGMHDPQAVYFNSGVLVIDAPAWRAADLTGACLSYLEEHAGELRFPDQDALNWVAYGNWLRLPKEYNHQMAWRLETEAGRRLTDAVVLHPVGLAKPWSKQYPQGDLKRLYEHYRDLVTVPAGLSG